MQFIANSSIDECNSLAVCLPVLQVALYGIASSHDAQVKSENNVLHIRRSDRANRRLVQSYGVANQ